MPWEDIQLSSYKGGRLALKLKLSIPAEQIWGAQTALVPGPGRFGRDAAPPAAGGVARGCDALRGLVALSTAAHTEAC